MEPLLIAIVPLRHWRPRSYSSATRLPDVAARHRRGRAGIYATGHSKCSTGSISGAAVITASANPGTAITLRRIYLVHADAEDAAASSSVIITVVRSTAAPIEPAAAGIVLIGTTAAAAAERPASRAAVATAAGIITTATAACCQDRTSDANG